MYGISGKIKFAAACAAYFFVTSSLAQSISDVDFTQHEKLKTTVLGFGGAYRALAFSNGTILVNPAGIAQKKGSVTVSGDFVGSGYMNSSVIGASIVDFQTTEYLALGLEYDRTAFSVANDVALNQITVTVAGEYEHILFVGANLKGYFSQVNSPFVADPNGVDADFGFLVKPIPVLALALTLENAFKGATDRQFPLILGFGAGVIVDPHFKFDIDITRNFETISPDTVNAYFGGELRAAEGVFLRGGFALDNVQNDNFYSLGISAAGPTVSLNFTFSQRLNPTEETYAGNLEFSF